jgi:hypothetical protein
MALGGGGTTTVCTCSVVEIKRSLPTPGVLAPWRAGETLCVIKERLGHVGIQRPTATSACHQSYDDLLRRRRSSAFA